MKTESESPGTISIPLFQTLLLSWGSTHIRVFPWRYSNDPYKIVVSEFMLHRTRAYQVVPIFEKFIFSYPDLLTFSKADIDGIYRLLFPIGLGWRITGMISALGEIWNTYGEIPLKYDELISIHGIGQYIAGATICFSQNKPQVLIDTNVVRVVGRVFGLNLDGEARRRKIVIDTIAQVIDQSSPRDFYYSIIDLAHTICTPRKPICRDCPLFSLPCSFAHSLPE